jgi:hypothetical protein
MPSLGRLSLRHGIKGSAISLGIEHEVRTFQFGTIEGMSSGGGDVTRSDWCENLNLNTSIGAN